MRPTVALIFDSLAAQLQALARNTISTRRLELSKDPRYPTQVYAIIRVDPHPGAVENQVTVKEIVSSLELAEAEVARLNELNSAKSCRYFWQATRLFTPGASAGTKSSPTSRPAS